MPNIMLTEFLHMTNIFVLCFNVVDGCAMANTFSDKFIFSDRFISSSRNTPVTYSFVIKTVFHHFYSKCFVFR